MTIKQAITKGMIMLKSNNVESPKLKARLLLQYVLDKPRQYIIVYDNKEIDKQQQWQYFVNIEKLTKGIPLQHITHRQEFMKMDFFVDENVYPNFKQTLNELNNCIVTSKKSESLFTEAKEYVLQKLEENIKSNDDKLVESYLDMLFEVYRLQQKFKI